MTGCPCTGPCLCAPDHPTRYCHDCGWKVHDDDAIEYNDVDWHRECLERIEREQCLDNDDARDARAGR